ncbi:MAG: glutathione S-transferase family protein [Roseibium sp.]|uniref:glutathione S-transferase family protein n=1 Tax=Roseibium sp. TaxID=1936156 RepID=UPI002622FF6A|nr:glutathione S-transferase family protein [Roseibium sp.]MCV0426814.1 glutathione S-transferase family protein [Roseibium sp.]
MIELFGADYSVYVRSVRLALLEKGVDYRLVPIDVFALGGPPEEHLERHPFGKIPAFRHDDFSLYETVAILRYIDEAFAGLSLQPETPKLRARMTQILSVLNTYAYRTLVWDIYVERVVKPGEDGSADEVKIASALGEARKIIAALEALTMSGPFLIGDQLTLADCHAAPMLNLFAASEEGTMLLEAAPRLSNWLTDFRTRESFLATQPVGTA